MRYMGSKNRIKKHIIPIIQGFIDKYHINTYVEPFVGGANVIDKIKCSNKFGYDSNKYLIALLQHAEQTGGADFPEDISEEEYKKIKADKEGCPEWYSGLVGFCGSFANKFWGGYARSHNPAVVPPTVGSIRNIKKQAPNLKGIKFSCCSYLEMPKYKNALIYCDPPYANTTKYNKQGFNHEEYYAWIKEQAKDNIVLCSESWMPEEFKIIWHKETTCKFDCNSSKPAKLKIENLYLVNTNL